MPFDPTGNRWAPADGRSITGSDLARKAERHGWPLPRNAAGEVAAADLRGVFLRGLNRFDEMIGARHEDEGDPNGAGRTPGALQPDGLKAHTHYLVAARGTKHLGISSRRSGKPGKPGVARETAAFGGPETRPRNAAVFFYLRINK